MGPGSLHGRSADVLSIPAVEAVSSTRIGGGSDRTLLCEDASIFTDVAQNAVQSNDVLRANKLLRADWDNSSDGLASVAVARRAGSYLTQ